MITLDINCTHLQQIHYALKHRVADLTTEHATALHAKNRDWIDAVARALELTKQVANAVALASNREPPYED